MIHLYILFLSRLHLILTQTDSVKGTLLPNSLIVLASKYRKSSMHNIIAVYCSDTIEMKYRRSNFCTVTATLFLRSNCMTMYHVRVVSMNTDVYVWIHAMLLVLLFTKLGLITILTLSETFIYNLDSGGMMVGVQSIVYWWRYYFRDGV